MVILGADLHKRSHTVVVIDETGRKLAEKTSLRRPRGISSSVVGPPAGRTGVGARGLPPPQPAARGRSAARWRAVVRVPPKLMAGARRSGREPGKSDPIDALAVARAALREPDLPVATLDGPERDLRLLVDHREDLVANRTQDQPAALAPSRAAAWRGAQTPFARPRPVLAELEGRLADQRGDGRSNRSRVRQPDPRAEPRDRRPRARDRQARRAARPRLLALPGLRAAHGRQAAGRDGRDRALPPKAAFARHNGSAPVPVWSGNAVRHRLSRGGNRQLNVVLHRIAITQMHRRSGPAYFDHRLAAATPRPRPSAPCAAGSATRSSAGCATMKPFRPRSGQPAGRGLT